MIASTESLTRSGQQAWGVCRVRKTLVFKETEPVTRILQSLWKDERGQDIAEYAVMLAVILVIVVGTVRLIGTNASSVFSSVGSSIQ
jgi:Flp pilus assembly pilin Flp